MPSIKQSQKVDPATLGPRVEMQQAQQQVRTGLPVAATAEMSAFMTSSMPGQAASYDLFVRQFYGGVRVPQQRILPVLR